LLKADLNSVMKLMHSDIAKGPNVVDVMRGERSWTNPPLANLLYMFSAKIPYGRAKATYSTPCGPVRFFPLLVPITMYCLPLIM
jgi:hypothetical protein